MTLPLASADDDHKGIISHSPCTCAMNLLTVVSFRTVSAMKATLGFFWGSAGRRAILRVSTKKGINEGSKTYNGYSGWRGCRRRVKLTTSAPRITSGYTFSCIRVSNALHCLGSIDSDQSRFMNSILWYCEDASIQNHSGVKNKRKIVGNTLHDKLILSRHRVKTSSLTSVRNRNERGDDGSMLWRMVCRVATIIPRKPIPEPSSRTRLDITMSKR